MKLSNMLKCIQEDVRPRLYAVNKQLHNIAIICLWDITDWTVPTRRKAGTLKPQLWASWYSRVQQQVRCTWRNSPRKWGKSSRCIATSGCRQTPGLRPHIVLYPLNSHIFEWAGDSYLAPVMGWSWGIRQHTVGVLPTRLFYNRIATLSVLIRVCRDFIKLHVLCFIHELLLCVERACRRPHNISGKWKTETMGDSLHSSPHLCQVSVCKSREKHWANSQLNYHWITRALFN